MFSSTSFIHFILQTYNQKLLNLLNDIELCGHNTVDQQRVTDTRKTSCTATEAELGFVTDILVSNRTQIKHRLNG